MSLTGKLCYLCLYFVLLLAVFFLLGVNASASEPNRKKTKRYDVEKGVVTEILEERIMRPQGIQTRPHGYKLVKVKITSGERKGQLFVTKARLSGIPGLGVDAKVGVRVLVHFIGVQDEVRAFIVDYDREGYIYVIVGIFFFLLVLVGKMKGLKSIISLCCTLFLVFFGLLPVLKNGYNPVLASITTAVLINIIVFVILTGFTRKSFTAIVGTSFGVASAGLIAFIIGLVSHTTGIPLEEAQLLYFKQAGTPLDFRGLVFAGVLIGSLGAVMDVAMSIASSLEEMQVHNQTLTAKDLFHSGMNIGRDIMGTMSNTLILAYVGGSISFLLLLIKLARPYVLIINSNVIVGEIIQGIAGAIGIVLAAPFTSLAGAYLTEWRKPLRHRLR